jgi:hypothetical protein
MPITDASPASVSLVWDQVDPHPLVASLLATARGLSDEP